MSRPEMQHRVDLNAWRRTRFAQFPHRPGQHLPGGLTGFQSFFQTAETVVAAFHRPGRVAVGQGACLQCEGIGWLLYVDQHGVLGEYQCPVCAGTGSWPQAQRMAGSTTTTYRETARSPYAAPSARATSGAHAAPELPSPPVIERKEPAPTRRRSGARGIVRAIVAHPVYLLVSYLVAQPIYAIIRAPSFTTIVALLIGVGAAVTLNQVIFGPLRDYQVLGPLWIIPAPIYLAGGSIFLCSIFTRSDPLSSLAFKVFEGAMSSREALSRIPLGR